MDEVLDMAGDWIKMRTALANDPAVIAIALDLDVSEFEVVGMLHHIWSWADSQSQDGHIKRVTEKWVDRYVHHVGFAKSMSDAGWLILEEDGITFPNFGKHNGESAKKRAEAAERQRLSRENKAGAAVTDPSQQSCDKSVTREEKRILDQKPLKAPPTPKTKKVEIDPVWFATFWKLYPNKVAKPKALEAFTKKCRTPEDFDAIMNGLKQHVVSELFVKDEGRFQPHPTTWLNQERYNDEVKPYVRSGSANPGSGAAAGARRLSLVEQSVIANAKHFANEHQAHEPDAGAFDGEFARVNPLDGSLMADDD